MYRWNIHTLNWKDRQSNTFITHSGLVFNPLYFNDGYATGGKKKQREGRFVPEQGARLRGEQTDLIMGFVASHTLLDVITTSGQNAFHNNLNVYLQINVLMISLHIPEASIILCKSGGMKRDISCF